MLAMSSGHFNPARRDRLTACSAKRAARTNGQYLTDRENKLAMEQSQPFLSWLQSFLSTSQKSFKGASRVVLGLYRFYKFADSDFRKPLPDLVKNTQLVNDWLMSIKDFGIGPSGLQSLVKCLILYLDWLHQQQMADCKREEMEKIEGVKAIYARITRRLNKEKKTQVLWHREEEADCRWASIVGAYIEAEARALKRLEPVLKKPQLNQEEVVFLRRTLMLGMVRANALRESAVYGLTIGEAEEGLRRKTESGDLEIRVHDHKTGRTSGSVEVKLGPRLADIFKVYIRYRKQSRAQPNDPFFSQRGSKPMTTSLAIEFKNLAKAVQLSDIPSPTHLRKAVQSLAPVKTQKEREALAGLLHHSPGVAMMHYRRETSIDRQASRQLLSEVLAMGESTSPIIREELDRDTPDVETSSSPSTTRLHSSMQQCSASISAHLADVSVLPIKPLVSYAFDSEDDSDMSQ